MYVVGKGFTVEASQRDEAIKWYGKTIENSPNHADAYYRLTLMSLLQRDYKSRYCPYLS